MCQKDIKAKGWKKQSGKWDYEIKGLIWKLAFSRISCHCEIMAYRDQRDKYFFLVFQKALFQNYIRQEFPLFSIYEWSFEKHNYE